MKKKLLIILGNQLFPINKLKTTGCNNIFMAEDIGLCTYVKHHKQKISFFLTAMRDYRDELSANQYNVYYEEIDSKYQKLSYIEKLDKVINQQDINEVKFYEIADKLFRNELINYLEKNKIKYSILKSPMFLINHEDYDDVISKKRLFMASFYQKMRRKFNILIDTEGKPIGGKWSFDEENRKKLPKDIEIIDLPKVAVSDNAEHIQELVNNLFDSHPGKLQTIWLPTNRKEAQKWFKNFLKLRFPKFGDYEDAIDADRIFLFHSVISPLMNIGLLMPGEIINEAIEYAETKSIPLNSLEGFVRQILGWREFIKVVYELKSDEQEETNFFSNERKLKSSWYDGSTGLLPLDDCIKCALKDGYSHHIPRLMIICNLMNMCEIDPKFIIDPDPFFFMYLNAV